MSAATSKDLMLKSKLKKSILDLNDGSKFDFAEAYLNSLSVERLKHILLYVKTMRIKKKK